jgi:hypothetical protein
VLNLLFLLKGINTENNLTYGIDNQILKRKLRMNLLKDRKLNNDIVIDLFKILFN